MSAPPAHLLVAAGVRAEREKARAEVLASYAAWRQGKTPLVHLRESPLRASKTAALASIASQSIRLPPEDRPGFVPIAAVVVEGSQEGASAPTAGSAASSDVAVAHLPGSPNSASDSSSSEDFLVGVGVSKGGGGFADSDDCSSNLNVPTDAEVSRYTFHEHLVHYMDGEKISHWNRKVVELVLLVEAGSYVRGLNPMHKP